MNRENSRSISILVFLLAAAILFYRAPLRIEHGFLWAEDGPVFLVENRLFGMRAIIHEHAGYLHLVPRIVAWAQSVFTPMNVAPYFLAWACWLIAAGSSAYIASALRSLPVGVAVLLALSPVLSPQDGELLMNVTNLQWLLCPLLVVLMWQCLFDPPETWIAPRAALSAALAMTGPFGILLTPAVVLAMVYAARRKPLTRRQVAWLVVFALGVALQVVTLLRHPQAHGAPAEIAWVSKGLLEIFGGLLPGAAVGIDPSLAGAALLALAFVVVCAASRSPAPALLLVFGVGVWAVSVLRINNPAQVFAWHGGGSRYLYLPILFAMWAAIVAALTARHAFARAVAGGLCLLVVLAGASHFEAAVWPAWEWKHVADHSELRFAPGWSTTIPD